MGTDPLPVVVVVAVVVDDDETVGESFDSSARVADVPIYSAAASLVPNRWMKFAG